LIESPRISLFPVDSSESGISPTYEEYTHLGESSPLNPNRELVVEKSAMIAVLLFISFVKYIFWTKRVRQERVGNWFEGGTEFQNSEKDSRQLS
jgi:hypothetical protein